MWEKDSLVTRKSRSWILKQPCILLNFYKHRILTCSFSVYSVWIWAAQVVNHVLNALGSIVSMLKFPEIICPSNWVGGTGTSFCHEVHVFSSSMQTFWYNRSNSRAFTQQKSTWGDGFIDNNWWLTTENPCRLSKCFSSSICFSWGKHKSLSHPLLPKSKKCHCLYSRGHFLGKS